MSLVRWDPFREMDDLTRRFRGLWGGFPSSSSYPSTGAFERQSLAETEWMPSVDIHETPESYVITAEVPGVKKQDIEVDVKDGILTFSGERKSEIKEEGDGNRVHRVERTYGRFLRSFTLPDNVNANMVKAHYDEGLLTITLGKEKSSKATAHKVKID